MWLVLICILLVVVALIGFGVKYACASKWKYTDLSCISHSGFCNTYVMLAETIRHVKSTNKKLYLRDVCISDVIKQTLCHTSEMFDIPELQKQHQVTIQLVTHRPSLVQHFKPKLKFTSLQDHLPFAQPRLNMPTYEFSPEEKNHLVVLHLKIGVDCIEHYSSIVHNISARAFEHKWRDMHIRKIKEIIHEKSIVYICTPNRKDPIVDFVRGRCARVLMKPQMADKLPREQAAMVEMQIVRQNFTGSQAILPVNFTKQTGSSFSTWLIYHCNFRVVHELDPDKLR